MATTSRKTLDDRVLKQQQPETTADEEREKEEKKPSVLESIVNEAANLGKSIFNYGLSWAAPFAVGQIAPYARRDAAILSGAFVAGDYITSRKRGMKYTLSNVRDSSFVGAALTLPFYHAFSNIHKIPTDTALGIAAKAGAWGGAIYPLAMGLTQIVDYTIKNKKIAGLVSYLKENYWNSLKLMWTRLLAISYLNIFFAPSFLNIPIAATLDVLLAIVKSPKDSRDIPEHMKRDRTPYFSAAYSVAGKAAKNMTSYLYQGAYGFGNALRSLFPKPKTASPKNQTGETTSKYVPFPTDKSRQHDVDSDKIKQFPSEMARRYDRRAA